MMDDTRKKRHSFSRDAERIWNRSRKLGFYLRLGGLFSLQSSSSIPTRGGHSCARTPRALPLAAPCARPGVPKRSALSVRGQPAEPSRVGRFCEGHLPRRWKVPACVNALTRNPYALLSGTMVFAAQELLRDNLSTPQNVKFAGAFPTPGSARAPLGRARRGAATVGVARETRFFIRVGGGSQSPRRISNRTRFATFHRFAPTSTDRGSAIASQTSAVFLLERFFWSSSN